MSGAGKNLALALGLTLALSGCAPSVAEKYDDKTKGASIGDWRWEQVWRPTIAGVVLNAAPGFHLLGLVIDTLYVVSAIDDTVYGTGAIVARSRGCPGLVQEEDYALAFAWAGADRAYVESALRTVYDRKTRFDEAEQGLALAARRLVEQKVNKKISVKIGSKIAIKVSTKALAGFVPAVGPVVAGVINYQILSGIQQDAQGYFEFKARVACA